ncbi:hypothetical protein IFM89_027560 [Coptis chinensis]|uniref:Guanosine nucleotide diphosphate dissociation inhibitor n=1 Tax=Coptis chinensis TaxID=261450 RepID=A0A835HMN0_9MAGN|nr:hypothetical protein IFM89_027560 [Coptis chinensis]
MDEEYDVIVLGTGLKECILSGLLSVDSLKLWKRFRGDDKPPPHLGSSRDYNVDMIPKFMMANGTLVRKLIHTDVTKYLSFKAVDGSFVFNKGKVHKVPTTDMEALKSPLMGLFEKRRARKFFIYVQDYKESEPQTHEGMDRTRVTTRQLIAKYGLDDNTVDFIGHALALHRDDRYLDEPSLDTVMRMKLYAESLAQFDEEGKVFGVISEGEIARCKKVVCDPSYLLNKVRKVGRVARAICIMSHPIPNRNDSHSVQVILPHKQLGSKSDMYLFYCSYSHNVAAKGKFIAFVSTEAETYHPEVELKQGIDLLGPVDEIFFDVYDRYEPVNEPSLDNCFISMSYDATTHFESTLMDVLNMYTLITGKAAFRVDSNNNYLYCLSTRDKQYSDLNHFQKQWIKGEPVIVRDVLEFTSGLSWDPLVVSRAMREKKNSRLISQKKKKQIIEGSSYLEVSAIYCL